MNVKELIELLRQFPPELEVFVVDWMGGIGQPDVSLRDVYGATNEAALAYERNDRTREAVVIG